MDNKATIDSLKQLVKEFVEERDWQQYHSPKNLSMCLAGEAAELMELFTWVNEDESQQMLEQRRKEVEHELADIAFNLLNFCMRYNIDLSQALEEKIRLNALKYPIEKSKSKILKYNQLK